MNIINTIVLIILLAAFVLLTFTERRRNKKKIRKVFDGKMDDKRIANLLKKANEFSKSKFFMYASLGQGVPISIVVVLLLAIKDLLTEAGEINVLKYLIIFLFLFVIFSLNGILQAAFVWKLARNKPLR